MSPSEKPEERARVLIDQQLTQAGWQGYLIDLSKALSAPVQVG